MFLTRKWVEGFAFTFPPGAQTQVLMVADLVAIGLLFYMSHLLSCNTREKLRILSGEPLESVMICP